MDGAGGGASAGTGDRPLSSAVVQLLLLSGTSRTKGEYIRLNPSAAFDRRLASFLVRGRKATGERRREKSARVSD